jgi:hypothetical protein
VFVTHPLTRAPSEGARAWETATKIAGLDTAARFFGARTPAQALAWAKAKGYVEQRRGKIHVTGLGEVALVVGEIHGYATEGELDEYVAAR